MGNLTLSPVQTDPEWRRRRDVAARHFVPWLQRIKRLGGATILEYGCGTGPVSCAFAPHVRRHIGYDIVPEAIDLARVHVQAAGAGNVELHSAPADRILDAVAQHRDEVDVMLLYAVLEHMTPRERLDLLELAMELVHTGGLVVVVESPNRLCAVDWHTSFLPFLCQLPEELALVYARRSERPDYLEALQAAAAKGAAAHHEVFVRWGRGLSFHEFELVLGDLGSHVVAGGYERELMVERPVHAEEMALARQLERSRPDLPPVFSRYWLDFAVSPEPQGTPRLIWPWTMETSRASDARWTRWDTIEFQPGRPLPIELPCATSRVMVTVSFSTGTGYVTLTADGIRRRERAAAAPSNEAHAEFRLPAARDTFSLTMSDPGYLHFVGYEAPAKRAGTVFAGN